MGERDADSTSAFVASSSAIPRNPSRLATVAIQLRVPGTKHFAHPAGTEAGNDFVRAESGTGNQRQAT